MADEDLMSIDPQAADAMRMRQERNAREAAEAALQAQEPAGPPPPPPAKGGGIPFMAPWDAAKNIKREDAVKAARVGAAAVLAPINPAGVPAAFAGGEAPPPGPGKPTESAPAKPDEQPPPAQGSTQEPSILLNRGGGGPGQVVPAGMYPDSRGVETKRKEISSEAKEAYGASTGLALEGAKELRDADVQHYNNVKSLYGAQLSAIDDAESKHRAIQDKRAQMTASRLAEIESLNSQAQQQESDVWTDRHALAGMLGTIMAAIGAAIAPKMLGGGIGLAMAGNLLNKFSDQDIAAKLGARKSAGEQANRQINLLKLHQDALGDEDKAVQATKLAHYDSILAAMDAYKADRQGQVSQAAYDQLRSEIVGKRAETLAGLGTTINESYAEKWHKAQALGGGGGPGAGAKYVSPTHIITVPASDKTGEKETHVAVPEAAYKDLSKMQGATNSLVQFNNDALKLRKELREVASVDGIRKYGPIEARKRANTLTGKLEDLQRQRISYEQKAEGEGVTRDPEFVRAMKTGVNYTEGIYGRTIGSDTEKKIEYNSGLMQAVSAQALRGATGQVVKNAYATDANGQLIPQWQYTGEVYRSGPVAPEKDDVK